MRSVPVALLVAGCSFGGHPIGQDGAVADGPVVDGPIMPVADARLADARPPDARPPDASAPDARPPDASAPDASAPDASPGCPDSYTPAGSTSTSRYRTVTGAASWTTAEADCEDDGAGTHLVVIDNAAESGAIDALILGGLWVGVTDRVTEGTFLAVTGGPAPYLVWNPFQPDDFFGEDCVIAAENGNDTDIDCAGPRPYVCECDGTPADPSTY